MKKAWNSHSHPSNGTTMFGGTVPLLCAVRLTFVRDVDDQQHTQMKRNIVCVFCFESNLVGFDAWFSAFLRTTTKRQSIIMHLGGFVNFHSPKFQSILCEMVECGMYEMVNVFGTEVEANVVNICHLSTDEGEIAYNRHTSDCVCQLLAALAGFDTT